MINTDRSNSLIQKKKKRNKEAIEMNIKLKQRNISDIVIEVIAFYM